MARAARPRTRLSTTARRRQLLELGLEAFGSQPYDEVSIEAIAATAGISHGLVFHYFATKRDYYLEVLRAAASELISAALAGPGENALARLHAGLSTYFEFVERRAGPYRALLRGGVGSDRSAAAIVDATRAQFVAAIHRDLVALGVDDDEELRVAMYGWVGFVEAIALQWIEPGRKRRRITRARIVALASRAMLAIVPPGTLL